MAEDQFVLADRLYDEGGFEEAFELFSKLAEAGDTSAMTRLADMYSAAKGVEYDFEKIIHWEEKAAGLGDPTGMYNLGITYRNAGDVRKARQWLEKALQCGDGEAALEIAKLYLISEKETETVRHYLELAQSTGSLTEDSSDELARLMKEISSRKP